MKLVLESWGIEVDTSLADYLRSTVVFALWHHEQRLDVVRQALLPFPSHEVDLAAVAEKRINQPRVDVDQCRQLPGHIPVVAEVD